MLSTNDSIVLYFGKPSNCTISDGLQLGMAWSFAIHITLKYYSSMIPFALHIQTLNAFTCPLICLNLFDDRQIVYISIRCPAFNLVT